MLKFIKTYPAICAGLVQAVITLGAAFGLKLTAEQVAAITTLTAAVLAALVHQNVTPTPNLPPAPPAALDVVVPPPPPAPPT